MEKIKTLDIKITDNGKDGSSFEINADGLQRFEMIGILEVAIMHIKDELRNSK